MVCLLFFSLVSIEAQVTNDSTITHSSDTEEQQQQQSSQEDSLEEENNKAIMIAFTNVSNDRNYTAIE
jgi:hypothetical protein